MSEKGDVNLSLSGKTILTSVTIAVLLGIGGSAVTVYQKANSNSVDIADIREKMLTEKELHNTLHFNKDRRISSVEEWQLRWPTHGELRMDVVQNNRIDNLSRTEQAILKQLDDMETEIRDLKQQVFGLQVTRQGQ